MPITAALAARLAKRGVQVEKPKDKEEVFAEDKGVLNEYGKRLPADWDKVY